MRARGSTRQRPGEQAGRQAGDDDDGSGRLRQTGRQVRQDEAGRLTGTTDTLNPARAREGD